MFRKGRAGVDEAARPASAGTAAIGAEAVTAGDSVETHRVASTTGSGLTSKAASSSDSKPSSLPSLAKLRVQVVSARGLTGKDRNGLSDPFVLIDLPGAPPPPTPMTTKRERDFYKRRTTVQPKTLEPQWKEGENTFEWDITPDWYRDTTAASEGQVSNDDQASTEKVAPPTAAEDSQLLKTPLAVPAAHLTESPSVEVKADPLASAGARLDPDSRPGPPVHRPSNVRKLSSATTKLLGAPVRMTARGAVATGRAVRKRGPSRPLRLRRGNKSNGTVDPSTLQNQQSSVAAIEFVVWDKDKWSGNDYMGEGSVQVASWIVEGKSAVWEEAQPIAVPLVSSRPRTKVSGELIVKIGFLADSARQADEVYNKLILASSSIEGAGLRSIPADQSVGTTGPSEAFVDYESSSDTESEAMEELQWDDGSTMSESDDDDDDEATTATETETSEGERPVIEIPVITASDAEAQDQSEIVPAEGDIVAEKGRVRRRLLPRRLRRSPSVLDSRTGSDTGDAEVKAEKQSKIRVRVRRRRVTPEKQGSLDSQEGLSLEQQQQQQQQSQKKFRKRRRATRGGKKKDFAFQTELGMDIIGIVQMEVKGAQDLPRWKNSLGTSFDMDPFVIVSFGQRIFRTRVARHSLNPTWDEKLLFRVRQHEANFVTKMAIYDWDKLSSNDYVGSTELKISDLMEAAPKPDPETGLYDASHDGTLEMKAFHLALSRNERMEDSRSLGKHAPVLTVEAKYTPYDSLRQRFWRQLLTQYDTNDSGTLSSLELTSMLDSLGSTLTNKTIEGMFSQFGKKEEESEELTINEAIIALEREIKKPWSEKRYVDRGWDATPAESGTQTPALLGDFQGGILAHDAMDFSGPHAPSKDEGELSNTTAPPVPSSVVDGVPSSLNEKSTHPLPGELQGGMTGLSVSNRSSPTAERHPSSMSSSVEMTSTNGKSKGDSNEEQEQVERVIVLKSCPLCHMPRLSRRAEVDIVTHLAVCASQDWRRVDSMVVRNFVTASQAHRKWYTKVITKISQGQYSLGANSANIIVQDRMTGEMLEEKMQVYVRLGIRLLYKGARSRMEGARVKRMLKNMSIKQGRKFDSPASAREIPQFIAFHNLSLDEIRDPLDSYKTFNEFFYRKLKERVRPIADAEDPTTLVSSADCRLMAFASITEATKVWIKGREFTLDRLLGNGAGGEHLDTYRQGGSLIIFRLAPQDYHRFHCPADAIVRQITFIQGQYYTVNPMAIRSAIDVYGENVRAVVRFQSDEFGFFYCVCIGAMMVGSINLVVKEGDRVKRGDEFGYYAFGGSTNVCIFEQGRVELDEDLLANSRNATETLVRVGMRIGKATSSNTAPSTASHSHSSSSSASPRATR